MRPPSSSSRPRTRLGGPLRSDEFGGRVVDLGPDGFLGPPARGGRPLPRGRARRRARADRRRGARRCGPAGRLRARCPRGWRSGSRPGSGPRRARGILGLRGQLGLARDAVLPRPDVRGPHRRPLHRPARGAQARPAGRRHAGRSAHRRHPRRLGRRHVRRRRVPAAAGRRPAPGRPHACPAAPRCPPRRPRRAAALLGARRAAWRRWSRRWPVGLRRRAGRRPPRATRRDAPRARTRWELDRATPARASLEADAVVLADAGAGDGGAPPPARRRGGRTARGHRLRLGRRWSTFRVGADDVPPTLDGTGFLVPAARARPRDATRGPSRPAPILDRKWPHLARPTARCCSAPRSVGSTTPGADGWTDEEVARAGLGGAGRADGGRAASRSKPSCTRFPDAFPQYRVHHLLRTAGVEAAVGPPRRAGRGRCGLPRGRHPGLHRQRPGRGTALV